MRQKKAIIPTFEFHDRTGIQKYLEKQAQKGWMLTQLGKYRWKFQRTEPRKLHFAVVYFPEADLFDPAPGEAEVTFREFCAHSGWILAGSNAQMQIFYSEQEDPTPIETDPLLEVENIHKAMKRGNLPGYWLLILSALLQLWVQGMAIHNDVLRYLSHNINLLMAANWSILLFLVVYHLVHYHRWHRKAVIMARNQNLFPETRSARLLTNILTALLGLGFLVVIVTMENRGQALLLILSVAAVYGIMTLTELVRKKMQKDGWDAPTNRKTTQITTVVLVLVLYFVLAPAMADVLDVDTQKDREETLAVTIWDLLGGDAEDYGVFYLTDQESMLLKYQHIHQFPEEIIRTDLQYELVNVKMPFLYEFCLARLMGVPAYIENGAYREIDPTPWGADRAWQLFEGEKARDWYVLCYGDTILEIIPTWAFTKEQIAIIAESMK